MMKTYGTRNPKVERSNRSRPTKESRACGPTAATNALDHHADIPKVQEWLDHANISTTQFMPTAKPNPRIVNI
jgi:hypothetical protein